MTMLPMYLMQVVYVIILVYMALRFIRAHERIADAVERHLSKGPL